MGFFSFFAAKNNAPALETEMTEEPENNAENNEKKAEEDDLETYLKKLNIDVVELDKAPKNKVTMFGMSHLLLVHIQKSMTLMGLQ